MASNEVVKIDTHNLCVFCLCQSDTSISSDSKSWFPVLSYIQPNWNLADKTKYKFVIGRKLCDTPPVCSACKSDILQIESFHQKLLDLEERIKEVKIKLEIHAENVRGKMRADFVPPPKRRRVGRTLRSGNRGEEPAYGNYDERNTELVLWLRSNSQVSAEVTSNTIDFLSQLQGATVDSNEDLVAGSPSVVASVSAPVVPDQVKEDLPQFQNSSDDNSSEPPDGTMNATEAPHATPEIEVQPNVPITLTPTKPTVVLESGSCLGTKKSMPPARGSNAGGLGTRKRKPASKPSCVVLISKPGEAEGGIKVQAEVEEFGPPQTSEDLIDSDSSESVQCESVQPRMEISEALKRKHELIWVEAKQGYVPCPVTNRKRQVCDFCGVSVLQDEMPSHLASHVGKEYSYKCPNPKCALHFVTKWSTGYRIHIKRAARRPNKTCWLVVSKRKDWTWKTCDTCGEETESLGKFGLHLEEHETSEKNFSCPVLNCGKEFTVKQSVEYHVRSHTLFESKRKVKMISEKCRLCEKFLSGDKMAEHLQAEHNLEEDVIFRCQHCPHTVTTREDLVNHVAKHFKDLNLKSVSCNLCQDKNPPVKVQLFSHIAFRKHYLEEHNIGKKWSCEEKDCEYYSFTKHSVIRHARAVHNKGIGHKTYRCEDCFPQRTFSLERVLKEHRIKAHGAEPLKCRFCSETFSTFELKRKHEAVNHEGKESVTFTCDLCNATLCSRKSYRYHMKTAHPQTDEKEYKCDHCDKAYRSGEVLRSHVKAKHMPRTECVCEVCGRKLKTSALLVEHMRIHTGERPLVCEICGLRFRQKSSWRTHVNSHKTKGDKFKPKGTFDRAGGIQRKRRIGDDDDDDDESD